MHGKPVDWKPVEWKNNKTSPNCTPTKAHTVETTSLSEEQIEKLLKLLKSTPSIPDIPIASLVQIGRTLCAYSSIYTSWIIDLGASHHKTNMSHLFIFYEPLSRNKKVCTAYGNLSPIVGQGSIRLSEKNILKSVLHIPKLSCNLLSISRLSKDSNYRVIFSVSFCEFQDLNNGDDDWQC